MARNIYIGTCYQYSTLNKDIVCKVTGIEKTITGQPLYVVLKLMMNKGTLYTYTSKETTDDIQRANLLSIEDYNNAIDKAIAYLQNLKQ